MTHKCVSVNCNVRRRDNEPHQILGQNKQLFIYLLQEKKKDSSPNKRATGA